MDLFSQIEREFENLYLENLERKLVEHTLLTALLQGTVELWLENPQMICSEFGTQLLFLSRICSRTGVVAFPPVPGLGQVLSMLVLGEQNHHSQTPNLNVWKVFC